MNYEYTRAVSSAHSSGGGTRHVDVADRIDGCRTLLLTRMSQISRVVATHTKQRYTSNRHTAAAAAGGDDDDETVSLDQQAVATFLRSHP